MFFSNRRKLIFFILASGLFLFLATPVLASTTQVHIVKYANDRTTILSEKTLTYQEMEDTLPVLGDGSTHYYLQGPVFIGSTEEERWNPDEDTNAVPEKDMGAVKGTDVKDLCNLVGGMSPGDTVVIKAADGLSKEFAYKNVYAPSSRQGPIAVTWYCSGISTCTGPNPDSGYSDGMRLVFFADDSVNPWGEHVFGNFDWHESADPQYWYYYMSGTERYPTTTGLSVKYVSDILIYSSQPNDRPVSGGVAGETNLPGAAPALEPSRYGYNGSKLTTYASGNLNGTILTFQDPNSTPVVVSNRVRNYSLAVDVPAGANLTMARLYVYISRSHGINANQGFIPPLSTRFNDREPAPGKMYIDTDGDEQRNVSATFAYDVLPLLKRNGTYTVSLRNTGQDQYVFTADGVMLLVSYEQENGSATRYWIDEGCDVIMSQPKKGIFPADATTSSAFSGTINITESGTADLMMVATGLDSSDRTEHVVRFNNGTWYNAFSNLSEPNVISIPVTAYLNVSGNSASIESTVRKHDADYIVNRNAILVTGQTPVLTVIVLADPATISPYLSNLTESQTLIAAPVMDSVSTCRLSLHSDPEGALIFLEGNYLGKTTPYTVEVNPGDENRIRLELDGFVPVEQNLTVYNDTTICQKMYTPVYTTKGRTDDLVPEPDSVHQGGLYVLSRPGPSFVYIDGVRVSRRTPVVINGLKEGKHAIRLSLDLSDGLSTSRPDIYFEDREVYVHPSSLIPVDVAASTAPSKTMIIDSDALRGEPFTVNGNTAQDTMPAEVQIPRSSSYITVFHNLSYISYPITESVDENMYHGIKPRAYYNLNVSVDSAPQGAEVFIDGFRTGYSTPYTFANISDGPHRIIVSKPGYIPRERLISLAYTSVPISTTDVHVTLEDYSWGFLRVESNPPGAGISIDGLDSGEVTPYLFPLMPTGSHSLKVTGNNITKMFYDRTVDALQEANITADLNEYEG
jgi:hypothetical protein